jgi:predicted Zn-dependent protease
MVLYENHTGTYPMNFVNEAKQFDFDKLIDYINQAEALSDAGMHITHENVSEATMFYYFFTLNKLLEEAVQIAYRLQR